MNNISLELEPGKELIDPDPGGSLGYPADISATDTDDTGDYNNNSDANNNSDYKKQSSFRHHNSSLVSENDSFLHQQSRSSSTKTFNGCHLGRSRSLSKTKIRSRPKTVRASNGDYRCGTHRKRGRFNQSTPNDKKIKGTDHYHHSFDSASMDVPSLSPNFEKVSSLSSHQSHYHPAMPLPPPLGIVDDLSPEALFLFAAADVEALEQKLSVECQKRIEVERQRDEFKKQLQEMEQKMTILTGHCQQMASQQKEDCRAIFSLETRLRQQQIQYQQHEFLLFQK